ncbi:MAG: ammonium transporter [Phycisphaeraceae bacterium]|nr:ammonium transporter [Phycisphaeraceae bacterium]
MFTVNNVWMMVATFLVFIMHLGFATLETGLERAKNATNILFKNTLIPAIGLLTFAICGFNIAYPGDTWSINGILGFAGFGLHLPEGGGTSAYNVGYTYWTDFLFQGMFAATAATIVSGAVAGRVKLLPFLLFSTIYVAIAYPIVVSWEWGGGFISESFHDFAGSTLVHSVGGWGALMGAIILGPRTGKFVNGSVKAIPGHNLGLATIGVFLLWLGWFGFNGGSVLSADAEGTSFVLLTTNLAAAAGIIAASVTSSIVQKKPDLTMALNGCLAGLVGITAGADVVSPLSAVFIGLIAGVLVVLSVLFVDRALKIDDPVGAVSVHLVCGIWGTLAVGLFRMDGVEDGSFISQLKGVIAAGVFCAAFAGILFLALKYTIGIRVSREEELGGLDIGEHGMEAYSGFQIFTTT